MLLLNIISFNLCINKLLWSLQNFTVRTIINPLSVRLTESEVESHTENVKNVLRPYTHYIDNYYKYDDFKMIKSFCVLIYINIWVNSNVGEFNEQLLEWIFVWLIVSICMYIFDRGGPLCIITVFSVWS